MLRHIAIVPRMSEMGQKRRFDPLPATSGLPRSTDIVRPVQLVRFVPLTEVPPGEWQIRERRRFSRRSPAASLPQLTCGMHWDARAAINLLGKSRRAGSRDGRAVAAIDRSRRCGEAHRAGSGQFRLSEHHPARQSPQRCDADGRYALGPRLYIDRRTRPSSISTKPRSTPAYKTSGGRSRAPTSRCSIMLATAFR